MHPRDTHTRPSVLNLKAAVVLGVGNRGVCTHTQPFTGKKSALALAVQGLQVRDMRMGRRDAGKPSSTTFSHARSDPGFFSHAHARSHKHTHLKMPAQAFQSTLTVFQDGLEASTSHRSRFFRTQNEHNAIGVDQKQDCEPLTAHLHHTHSCPRHRIGFVS